MTQPHPTPQICDRTSLEVWMADMPREFIAVIASRAALRAVPMLVDDANGPMPDEVRSILLRTFRAMATASAGATWPRRVSEIWDIAPSAVSHVQIGISTAERGRHTTAGRLCSAAEDVVSLFAHPGGYILHAGNATTAAAHIAGSAVWQAVSLDAERLPAEWTGSGNARLLADGLHRKPLWPAGAPPQATSAWNDLKAALPADEDWWVWIHWYEDHLAGRLADQTLDFARVAIPDQDWERGPKHVNGIIARLTDGKTPPPRNSPPETPVASTSLPARDPLELVDQVSILDELIDHPIPELPSQLPSPLQFRFRDGALHTAAPPAPRLSPFRKPSVSEAWEALTALLSDIESDESGRNNPTLGRVLRACRHALGASFNDVRPILLGVHAGRLQQLSVRADELLLPEAAAELTALSEHVTMFLKQFPDWQAYATALARPIGDTRSRSPGRT